MHRRSSLCGLSFASLLPLLALVALLLVPRCAAQAVAPFDPNKKYSVVLGLLLDMGGSEEVQNLTDVTSVVNVARQYAAAPGFFQFLNQSSGVLSSVSVSVASASRETLCQPAKATLSAVDIVLPEYNVAALLGPPCSTSAEAVSSIAEYYQLPQITFGAQDDALSDRSTYPWLLQTVGSHRELAGVIVEVMLTYGWDAFTVIASRSQFGIDVSADLHQQAQNWNVDVLDSINYQDTNANWTAVLNDVQNAQAQGGHIFVVAADEVSCQQLLVLAHQRGLMAPDSVWISAGAVCVDPTQANGTAPAVLLPVLPGVLYVNSTFNVSAPAYQTFMAGYAALTGYASPVVPFENLLLFDSLMAMLYGMRNLFYYGVAPTPKTGALLLSALLANVSFDGVTGHVSFSSQDGSRIGSSYSVQQFNATGQPVLLATATVGGQTSTYDGEIIPTYNYTSAPRAVAYWAGSGGVPVAYTPVVLQPPPSSGISISTQVLTVIICIACLVGCCIIAGLCFVGLWRAKTTKVMQRLESALAETESARRNEAEAYKAKSQFLANMSHEIRTPMNGVCGMAALLSSTPLSDEQSEYVKSIEISTGHLLTVISDVLDFGKMESGKMELELTQCELVRIVEEAVDIICSQKGGGRQTIVTYVDPALPEKVLVDSTRLRQIITNLLSNGIKFGRSGPIFLRLRELHADDDHLYALQPLTGHEGVRIVAPGSPYTEHHWQADERVDMPQSGAETSSAGPQSASSSTTGPQSMTSSAASPLLLHVSIEDRGHGIAKAHLHKLFKPFSQSDSSITRQFGGTGLGLVISGKLAQMMGGTIWCESAQDVGSRFSFTFNAGSRPDDGAMPVTPVTPNDGASLGETSTRPGSAVYRAGIIPESTVQLGYRASASESLVPSPKLSAIVALPSLSLPYRFRLRVLVISPHGTLLHTLSSTLNALGCTVYACDAAAAANAFLRTERVDLLLIDYHADRRSSDSVNGSSMPPRRHSLDTTEFSESGKREHQLEALIGLPPAPPLIGCGDGHAPPPVAFLLEMEDEKALPLSLPSQKRLRKPLKQADLLRVLHQAELDARHRRERESASIPDVVLTVKESASGGAVTPATRSVSAPSTARSTRSTLLSRMFPLRILCVEDNVINQRLFVRMMQRMGYEVDVADNGLRCIEQLRATTHDPYDLVFMDMQMPEMDGLTCAHHIAAEYEQRLPTSFPTIDPAITIASVPNTHFPIYPAGALRPARPVIIALTANATAKDRALCLACGMEDYAAKPFTASVLEEKIRLWAADIRRRKAGEDAILVRTESHSS